MPHLSRHDLPHGADVRRVLCLVLRVVALASFRNPPMQKLLHQPAAALQRDWFRRQGQSASFLSLLLTLPPEALAQEDCGAELVACIVSASFDCDGNVQSVRRSQHAAAIRALLAELEQQWDGDTAISAVGAAQGAQHPMVVRFSQVLPIEMWPILRVSFCETAEAVGE